MQIIKILRVESPIHLWSLLKNREEVFECKKELVLFIDFVEIYMNGCKCDEDLNYDNMILSYNEIKNNNELLNYLIICFECDEIRFLK